MKNPKLFCLAVCCALCTLANTSWSQTETKPQAPAEDEFARKKPETKLTEVLPTDSLPASVLLNRAVNWVKSESATYNKTAGTTGSAKAECIANFPVKPKQLNPEVEYTGKITMKVVIECKDSKYRYTISDIRHVSKSGLTTGGSIDNQIPECGSNAMNEIVWKRLKAEALKDAGQVAQDIKNAMATDVPAGAAEEW